VEVKRKEERLSQNRVKRKCREWTEEKESKKKIERDHRIKKVYTKKAQMSPKTFQRNITGELCDKPNYHVKVTIQ